jgi:tetratricopeptide (TPR) repeat protein
LAREALALHAANLPPDDHRVTRDQFLLGQALLIQGKPAEAESEFRGIYDLYIKMNKRAGVNRPEVVNALAGTLEAQGSDDEAIVLLERELAGGEMLWRGLAVLLLKSNQTQEYRQHCHVYLRRAADTQNVRCAEGAAKVSLLLPVDGDDFKTACDLSDLVFAASKEGEYDWMDGSAKLIMAMAEYRQGRFESAHDWALRAVAASPRRPENRAASLFIDAAACAKLQRIDCAREALDTGEKLMRRCRTDAEYYVRWSDWQIAQHLCAESNALIDQANTSDSHASTSDTLTADETHKSTNPQH